MTADVSPEVSPVGRVYRLENWATGYRPSSNENPYLSPQQRARVLVGAVYGRPDRPDGHRVRTSRIVSASGRLVVTDSGSIYELGTPDPEYVAWVVAEFGAWNDENPVRVLTTDEPASAPAA